MTLQTAHKVLKLTYGFSAVLFTYATGWILIVTPIESDHTFMLPQIEEETFFIIY